MQDKHESVFKQVLQTLEHDKRVQNVLKIGFCRKWVREAIISITKIELDQGWKIAVEAREVDLEPGLSHTFLYMWIESTECVSIYILDGVGTAAHEPFLGKARDAPCHLHDSSIDMIERYRELGELHDSNGGNRLRFQEHTHMRDNLLSTQDGERGTED